MITFDEKTIFKLNKFGFLKIQHFKGYRQKWQTKAYKTEYNFFWKWGVNNLLKFLFLPFTIQQLEYSFRLTAITFLIFLFDHLSIARTETIFTAIGAIGFDVAANSGVKAAVSSFSFNHTTGTLTNGLIIVSTQSRDATDTDGAVTALSYNALALTSVRRDHGITTGTGLNSEIWRRVAPSSGLNSVSVTLTGTTDDVTGGSQTFSGVDQTNPINTSNGTYNANASSSSISVTTTVDNCMLVDSLYTNSDNAMTVGAGQNQDWNLQPHSAGDQAGGSHKAATTAGSYSMSWTGFQAGSSYAGSVAALTPAAAAATNNDKFFPFFTP